MDRFAPIGVRTLDSPLVVLTTPLPSEPAEAVAVVLAPTDNIWPVPAASWVKVILLPTAAAVICWKSVSASIAVLITVAN